jgi:hypothetical protein
MTILNKERNVYKSKSHATPKKSALTALQCAGDPL